MKLPIGAIIIWNKTIAEIPEDWALCNGSNGTPDLRGYFVRGATGDSNVGFAKTTESHNHARPAVTGSDGEHLHSMTIGLGGASGSTGGIGENQYGNSAATAGHGHGNQGAQNTSSNGAHTHPVGGYTNDQTNLPKYMNLFYIMKVV